MLDQILLIATLLLVRLALALVGYDCDSTLDNGTIVSLLEAGTCEAHKISPVVSHVPVELLLTSRSIAVDLLTCRVEFDTITSHQNDHIDSDSRSIRYYVPVNLPTCMYMHAYGKLQLGTFSFEDLSEGITNSRLVRLPASDRVNVAGNPAQENLKQKNIVNSYVHIVYKRSSFRVDVLENKIHLPVGTSCPYTDLECTDEEGYQNYWSPIFKEGCKIISHTTIYRGTAKKNRIPASDFIRVEKR